LQLVTTLLTDVLIADIATDPALILLMLRSTAVTEERVFRIDVCKSRLMKF
jgi:hypothetical protein